MPRAFRPFFIVLACIWCALSGAAYYYSSRFPSAHWIISALLPAFLLESALYLGCLFDETRAVFATFRPARIQSAVLLLSAILPYLIFSVSAGTFRTNAFYLLVGLSALFSFWNAVLPRRVAYDLGFLILAAAPLVSRAFGRIYISPSHEVRADILGHLMWIRVGIVALLVIREWQPGDFGMWPKAHEWRQGFLYFVALMAPLAALALGIHDVRFTLPATPWWREIGIAAGTFFAFLWVTALGEELFFRGVITRALLDWLPAKWLALVLSALLFGAAHLWFRPFPDWRSATVAALLGLGCAFAYWKTGSVRTPMVTHSLVVVAWKVFFRNV